MVSIRLDPAADLASIRAAHAELIKAVTGRARAKTVEIELAGDTRPGHLVLQLLASAAVTEPMPGRSLTFGARAGVEIARMDIQQKERS